jgi:aminoglycoside phosphotransferase (APT) family kinase protein
MVGCVLRNFNQQVVTIPRIIESGRTEYGISYIIEQEAYGVRPTSDVIRKMSESEFDKFSRKIAAFLHELHTIQNGEVLSKISDQTVFRDPLIFDDPRYQNKSCYSKENFAYKTIVHSDLVPRNILIDLKNNDHVSILDWGEVHYDYPFSEFYRMYTNNSTFDEHVIDSISREYMNLRDADRNKEKCTCCCTATCQTKQHAKPTMPYRLPLYMKKTYGYQM